VGAAANAGVEVVKRELPVPNAGALLAPNTDPGFCAPKAGADPKAPNADVVAGGPNVLLVGVPNGEAAPAPNAGAVEVPKGEAEDAPKKDEAAVVPKADWL